MGLLQNLAFLNPAVLWALAALPVIWWLLRATPPQPQRIRFPGTRLLKGLRSRQQTPARSPWWLTLLRLIAAALLIGALAEPVLNPRGPVASTGGPLVLVVDNGWASGTRWDERRQTILRHLDEATAAGRSVVLVPTAIVPGAGIPGLVAPQEARDILEALRPQPFAPDRMAATQAIAANLPAGTRSVVWLSDGLDHGGGTEFFARLTALANGGDVSVVEPAALQAPVAVRLAPGTTGSALSAEVLSAGGVTREVTVTAVSGAGQPLGDTKLVLTAGSKSVRAEVALPLELRNQIARLEIAGERSAGAVALLDSGSRWNRIGLISGASREQAQPLLAPLFYLERALAPFSDLVKADDPNTSNAIDTLLQRNVSVLVLADIGKLNEATSKRVADWVDKGGVLLRFAGPRMEDGGDGLLPAPLRLGGRALGGALSWSTPQALSGFEAGSPFAGLNSSEDVKVSRQVLADPALLTDETRIWARLADGTPLVTASKRKGGWLVLFHVTANSDWSSLPISGLFVDMLRRVVRLTGLADIASNSGGATDAQAAPTQASVLSPSLTLDGFGVLAAPPPTAEALTAESAPDLAPTALHPPGLYGPPGAVRALNVVHAKSTLTALTGLPVSFARLAYKAGESVPLKSWALMAALTLFLADVLAVLGLQTGWFRQMRPLTRKAAVLLLALVLTAGLHPVDLASAQTKTPADAESDTFALQAAEKTRLAFVKTGDQAADETSRRGLTGLSLILAARTAVEPDTPMGVRIETDELSFFPVLYWPVLPDARPLEDSTVARIDAYIKGGGMIVFDTRDSGDFALAADGSGGGGATALRRLVSKLDVPPLEPTPPDHVLGRAFYLLKAFPGRFDASPLWVERRSGSDADDGASDAGLFGAITGTPAAPSSDRPVRQDDGVSALLVTANDLAGAWAVDDDGQPLNAVIPGGEEQREQAFRVGVNIVMYALTGNYKADQVHVPALLERLGQ